MPMNTYTISRKKCQEKRWLLFCRFGHQFILLLRETWRGNTTVYSSPSLQIKIPLCQVDLAQNISEWKDVQSNKEDDEYLVSFSFEKKIL